MSTLHNHRTAFTLVELLVAMVIAAIVASMVAIALSGAQRSARETRGQAMIDMLNVSILQLYEQEASRRVSTSGRPVNGQAASQTQMIWTRDWLRATLPQSKADIDAGSGRSGAPAVGQVPFLRRNSTAPLITQVPLNSLDRSNVSDRYRARIVTTLNAASWAAAYTQWSPEHESAECLYQIFASSTLNGEPLLQRLRTRDIGDTDEDGMPEILDPWGQPVLWMRTPAGFYLKNRWVADESDSANWPTVAELRQTLLRLGPDPIDVLRTDPRYALVDDEAVTDSIDPTASSTAIEVHQFTFFCRPLVVSAGSDGEFDLVQTMAGTPRATTSNNAVTSLRTSPGSADTNPVNYPTTPVFFPDPFFSQAISGDGVTPLVERLGAVVDDGDRVDESSDNIYPVLEF